MGDRLRAGIYHIDMYNYSQLSQLGLASPRVALSSSSFGWDKGGNVTSAGWQATLCHPIWHVSSRIVVMVLRTAIFCLPSLAAEN